MQNQGNKKVPKSQASPRPRDKIEVPNWQRMLVYGCMTLPPIFLFLYVTGAWDLKIVEGSVKMDAWDEAIRTFAILLPVFGVLFYKQQIDSLEKEANAAIH